MNTIQVLGITVSAHCPTAKQNTKYPPAHIHMENSVKILCLLRVDTYLTGRTRK